MKKKKIYMYGAVTALLPIATVATIISCGDDNSKTDQNKMDGITMDMVKKALNITPDSGVLPTTIKQPSDKSATLNGLDDVKITISNWDNSSKISKGEIDATVGVSKGSLTNPPNSPFSITWSGYEAGFTIDNSNVVASKGIWWDYNDVSKTLAVNPGVVGLTNTSTVEGLFDDAISLADINHVDLPDTLTTIGDAAFFSSTLTSLTIPNSVTTIGGEAFYSSTLTSLTIPNSVTTIGEWAFFASLLTTLTLGDSLTTIGDYAFGEALLITLTLGNSVTTIGMDAFHNSPLTNLAIPDSVTSIGDNAFSSLVLASLTFEGNIPSTGGRVLFLGGGAFESLPITAITGGAGPGTWQQWATDNYSSSFKV